MDKIFLNLTVLPYRSLSKKGFKNLMLVVCFIFFSVGIFFWHIGAWPVFGFLGLDVFLLYYAFRINYKSGEIFETIKLIKQNLLITRNFPSGKKQTWNLEPYWTKVEILNPATHQHNLIIKSKNKVVSLGSFLNYNDKKILLKKIESALKSTNNH
jgi:uncharacterized membrane protein|tara:strand:- start:936 stop:1400 length:465 start_codon:yes stop_codon:yes gene_type:complete